MTKELCAYYCVTQGYSVAGTEAERQCFCGAAENLSGKEASESDCNRACRGDPNEMCGGSWRLSAYEIQSM